MKPGVQERQPTSGPRPNKLQYPICPVCDTTGYVMAFCRRTQAMFAFACRCDYGRACEFKARPWSHAASEDFSLKAPWEPGYPGNLPPKTWVA